MRSLPDFQLGDRLVRLPLTSQGAVDLAHLWLSTGEGERRERASRLLRLEPGLTLWCAAWIGGEARPSLDLLVERLAEPQERVDSLASELLRAMASAANDDAEWGAAPWPLPAAWPGDVAAWLTRAFLPISAASGAETPAFCSRAEWLSQSVGAMPTVDAPNLGAECEGLRARWAEASSSAGAGEPLDLRRLARTLLSTAANFERTLEQEKLLALREFAYGASHEINNPLANIATRAQGLLRDERDVERRRTLAVIAAQAMRAHAMIADVMLFAKPPALRREPASLGAIADRVISELREAADAQETALVRLVADVEPILVDVDAGQLAVAIRSVLDNGLEALHRGGRIELQVERAAADWAAISIADSGPGIAAAVRRRIFEPYFSGREAGRGLGIGLSRAWRIVTDHGGRIEVAPAPLGGALFTIWLPRCKEAAEPNLSR
ncbi:MAG: HAMP domain-containing sensor histidine kinase [Pirellulales bacterium]